MGLNVVVLSGNLTKDPISREVNDKKVVNATIAVNENKEKTTFVPLQIWGKLAEVLEKYTKKGSSIAIRGRLQVRSYEKEGNTIYVTEVVVQELDLLGSKQENNESSKPKDPINDVFGGINTDGLPF